MKTRLLSATAAAVLAAGAAVAQSPSLPPINPIPVVTAGMTVEAGPKSAPVQQTDKPVSPPPPTDPMPVPPPMPTPEQPCPDCENRFFDQHVGPKERFWARAEYMYLWLASAKVPTLAQDANGVAVLGGQTQPFPAVSGGQITFGMWLNDRHTTGLYGGGFMTDKRTLVSSIASDAAGNPTLTRPFVNALTGLNDSLLVSGTSGATVAAGALAMNVSARLDGAEGGVVWNICNDCNRTFNFLTGARYLDLDEQLSIYQSSNYLAGGPTYFPPHPAAGLGPVAAVQITDRFRTRNQFLGLQFGLEGEQTFGPLFVNVSPRVSFGTNRQTSDVDGSTTFVGANGQTVTVPGGLYAVGIPGGPAGTQGIFGKDTVTRFAVLAEATGRVGVQLTSCVRVSAGYTFIYLNNVARPGLEIQPVINPRVIPVSQAFGSTSGPNAPQRAYDRTDYVAHGILLGLEVRY